MDAESAGFVIDRIDVARAALLEAQQTIEKFNQEEDAGIRRTIDELLQKVEQLETEVRSGSYPS